MLGRHSSLRTYTPAVGSFFSVSSRGPLTCDDASRLTRLHRAPVSNSCHFSGPIRNHPDGPAEVLGQRPGAFAQFRHMTAETKQVLAESPQRSLTGFFGKHSGRSPSIHERFCSTCYLTAQWTLVIINWWSTVTVLGRRSAPRVVDSFDSNSRQVLDGGRCHGELNGCRE